MATELLAVARTYRQFAIDNPTYYGIMLQSAVGGFRPSQTSIDLAMLGLESLIGRIERGQSAGQVSAEQGARECAAWLWATCHGMISLELDGGGVRAVDADGNDVGGHQAFWFAWSQFQPDTLIWPIDA